MHYQKGPPKGGPFSLPALTSKYRMAFVSPRMNLKVWNSPQDPYDHEQLADNFLRLDRHDHSEGRGAQIGSAGIQTGSITNTHIVAGTIASGSISTGGISTGNLADGSVTTVKLADGAVTPTKRATPPMARVRLGTNFSVATSGTASTVNTWVRTIDADNMLGGLTTGITNITFNTAGTYLLLAEMSWASNATGDRQVILERTTSDGTLTYNPIFLANRITAASIPVYTNGTGNFQRATGMVRIGDNTQFGVGVSMWVKALQTSGGALNLMGSVTDSARTNEYTTISVYYLGA